MPLALYQTEADDAIAAAQIKAYLDEAAVPARVVVLSLLVWGAAEFVPLWSWAPALFLAYVATAVRFQLIRAYRHHPEARTPAQWGLGQTLVAAVNGASWGFVNTAMSGHVPLTYQLLIATVAAVSASAAASEGFSYFHASRAFICTSLVPLTVWFYAQADRLHLILGVMLSIYIPMLLWQGSKRHGAFIDALKLRFKNEFLAKELAGQRKIAEDAGQAKARFLAAASHDLRQPVTALAFFLELIRPEMTLTAKGDDYFAKAQQAAQAVSDLLGALLDISRLGANSITPHYESIPAADLLDEMRQEFGPLAEQKGIRLRVAYCSVRVDTDTTLLRQILRNLIANALRYTPSGTVLIGCRRRRDQLAIEVRDTGIGIHDEHQKLIFDEFFQVGNPERDRQRGLGLGLAIVDRAVTLLGATLALSSRPGIGSCFSVTLPMSAEQTASTPRAVCEAATPFDLENRLIVIVENEELIRQGMHALLESWGCDVISGPSGNSVLQQILALGLAVDAVISDFGLSSDENGIAVISELRTRLGKPLPALLMTGDTSQTALLAAKQAGLPILHKPVRPWLLRHTLCTLISPPHENGLAAVCDAGA